MIVAIFRGALHWFVGLIEVVAVVTAILLVGLIVGMTGFWILGRSLSKLEGPSVELDPREYELDEDVAGQVGSLRRDEDSPPSNL
jgi:hypothetical protein